ncbi:MAG: AGE family epimerase/isomerase [Oscillospiraceae bacterium]|nr:AGE family epimerase/isomerase [Oscillospiraceae bacterium]MBQ9986185.1 AGE family epimerase/isomerase [Oscillospiraceae bacterium]
MIDYKKLLTETILPKWIEISPDYEYGGVFWIFEKENHAPKKDTDKHIWFHGRAMWSYAMAHRICGGKQEYLDICEHIFKFMKKCTLPGGQLMMKTTRDGAPVQVMEGTYYTEMFGAMGCAQYYRICPREDIKAQAELYFDYMYDRYKAHRFTRQESNPCRISRCFGLHMAMLAAMQFVRNAGIRVEKAEELIDIALDQFKNGGFIKEDKKIINEHVAFPGFSLSDWDTNSSCPGHIYEAAWFVMSEGVVKKDSSICDLGRLMLECALPEGFEKIRAIVPTMRDARESFEKSLDSTSYLGWAQQEAALAYRLAYKIYGEEKYKKLADMFEEMIFSYYDKFEGAIWLREIVIENGEYADAKEKGVEGHINGPFHFERFLLAMGSLRDTGDILEYMG